MTYVILVKISLLITFLGAIFRFLLSYSFNNVKLTQIQIKVFDFVSHKEYIMKTLYFCYRFTWKLFTIKYHNLTFLITSFSGLILVFGVVVRVLLLRELFIPGQTIIFIFLGLNGVFRAIVFLGILLRTTGFWRYLLERYGQQKIPANSLGVCPSPKNFPNGNKNEDLNVKTKNEESQNKENFQKEQMNWTKVGALASVAAAVATIMGVSSDIKSYQENGELRREIDYHKNKAQFYNKRTENLEYLYEYEKQRAEAEKQRAEAEKQKAEAEKQRADELEIRLKTKNKKKL